MKAERNLLRMDDGWSGANKDLEVQLFKVLFCVGPSPLLT